MTPLQQQIFDLLAHVRGAGTFACAGQVPFTPPGLEVAGVGELAFPILPGQAEALMSQGRPAPFGKGHLTLTDPAVRHSQEVDASQVSFQSPQWATTLAQILRQVKAGLGLEDEPVEADLYKLLVYEKGGFFLPHKDSEKAPGMFGTLVIGLPSAHTGGSLRIEFGGEEQQISFAEAGKYSLPYAAFFADCTHEIRPVELGYRVCLVYNLRFADPADTPGLESSWDEETRALTQALAELAQQKEPVFPQVYVFEHAYTETNFEADQLKGHDRARAKVLRQAAEAAGYHFRFSLLTHHVQGDLEGVDDNYYEETGTGDPIGVSMGDDIFEEESHTSYWNPGEGPGLGLLPVTEEQLLTNEGLDEAVPSEWAAEGYTGNEGMTMDYWYHHGVAVLWPQTRHLEILSPRPQAVWLEWLSHYAQQLESPAPGVEAEAREVLANLMQGLAEEEFYYAYRREELDFTPAMEVLLRLGDESLLAEKGAWLLKEVYLQISPTTWPKLWASSLQADLPAIMAEAMEENDFKGLCHAIEVLHTLYPPSLPSSPADLSLLRALPDWMQVTELAPPYWEDRKMEGDPSSDEDELAARQALTRLLDLSLHPVGEAWQEAISEALTQNLTSLLLHDLYGPVLEAYPHPERPLWQSLRQACLTYLRQRVGDKPQPPADWRRTLPKYAPSYQDTWRMLTPFMHDPNQRELRLTMKKQEREQVEKAIWNTWQGDLATHTLRKGRSYTLVITKMNDAYDDALNAWQADAALLTRWEAEAE